MKFQQLFLILTFVSGLAGHNRECGRKIKVKDSTSPVMRIFGGKKVENSWPWLVALFDRRSQHFFCAGNLISFKHVVSGELSIYVKKKVFEFW